MVPSGKSGTVADHTMNSKVVWCLHDISNSLAHFFGFVKMWAHAAISVFSNIAIIAKQLIDGWKILSDDANIERVTSSTASIDFLFCPIVVNMV
jgi:hypothetical protein